MEPFRGDAYEKLARSRTGGALFHTNPPSLGTRVRGAFPFYAYGAATARRGVPSNARRSKLLECCCFGDRVFRFERRRALVNATGLCDGNAGTFDPDATLARYRRAKFVFSPRGVSPTRAVALAGRAGFFFLLVFAFCEEEEKISLNPIVLLRLLPERVLKVAS